MSKKDKANKKDSTQTLGITYKGAVEVYKVDSSGKRMRKARKNNAGTVVFFELIAKNIAGTDTSSLMPRYIRCFDEQGDSTTTSFISYNNPVVSKNNGVAMVSFQFLIPFTQLSEERPTTTLKLYNRTSLSGDVFASVDLDESFIGNGTHNHLVIWTISIGNNL